MNSATVACPALAKTGAGASGGGCEFAVRVFGAERAGLEGGLPRALAEPQMAKYRCLSLQVKREPQHLVYSMQIPGGEPQSLILC